MAETADNVEQPNTPVVAAKPPSFQRALIISAVLVGLLVIMGWFYDALMFAPLPALALVWQVLCALGYTLTRKWPMLKLTGLRMLIWLGAIMSLMFIHDYYLKTTRKSAETVLSALKTYHAREGRYPPNLEALAPRDIAVVPLWSMSPAAARPFRYKLVGEQEATKGENFDLRYFTSWRHQHIYESATGQWKLTD